MPYANCFTLFSNTNNATSFQKLLLTDSTTESCIDLFDSTTINHYIAYKDQTNVTPLGYAIFCENLSIVKQLLTIKGLDTQEIVKNASDKYSALGYCLKFFLAKESSIKTKDNIKKIIILLFENTKLNFNEFLNNEAKIHALDQNDDFSKFLVDIVAYIHAMMGGVISTIKQAEGKIQTWCKRFNIGSLKGILTQLPPAEIDIILGGQIFWLYHANRPHELDHIIYEQFQTASESDKDKIYQLLLNFEERLPSILSHNTYLYYETVMAIDIIAPHINLALRKIGKPKPNNYDESFFPRFLNTAGEKLDYNKQQKKIIPPRHIKILMNDKNPRPDSHYIQPFHAMLVNNSIENNDLRNGIAALYALESAESKCYQAIQFLRRITSPQLKTIAAFHSFIAYTQLFLQKPDDQEVILVELATLFDHLNPDNRYLRLLNENLVAMIIGANNLAAKKTLFNMLLTNLENFAESCYFNRHCLSQISSFFPHPDEIDKELISKVYTKEARDTAEIIKIYEQTGRQALLAPLYRIMATKAKISKNSKTAIIYYLRAFQAGDSEAAVIALKDLTQKNLFDDATFYIHLIDEALMRATQNQDSSTIIALIEFISEFRNAYSLLSSDKKLLDNIIQKYWTQNPVAFVKTYRLHIDSLEKEVNQLSQDRLALKEFANQFELHRNLKCAAEQLSALEAKDFVTTIPAELVEDMAMLIKELQKANSKERELAKMMTHIQSLKYRRELYTSSHMPLASKKSNNSYYSNVLPAVVDLMTVYLNRSAYRKGSIRRKIYLALKVLIMLPTVEFANDNLPLSAEQISTVSSIALAYLQKKTDESSQHPEFAKWALALLDEITKKKQIIVNGVDTFLRDSAKASQLAIISRDLEHAISQTYKSGIADNSLIIIDKALIEEKTDVALYCEKLSEKINSSLQEYDNKASDTIKNKSEVELKEKSKILEIMCYQQTLHSSSVIHHVINSLLDVNQSEQLAQIETQLAPTSAMSSYLSSSASSSSSSSLYETDEGRPNQSFIEFKQANGEIREIISNPDQDFASFESATRTGSYRLQPEYAPKPYSSCYSPAPAPSAPHFALVYPDIHDESMISMKPTIVSSFKNLGKDVSRNSASVTEEMQAMNKEPSQKQAQPPGGIKVSLDLLPIEDAEATSSSTSAISIALLQATAVDSSLKTASVESESGISSNSTSFTSAASDAIAIKAAEPALSSSSSSSSHSSANFFASSVQLAKPVKPKQENKPQSEKKQKKEARQRSKSIVMA